MPNVRFHMIGEVCIYSGKLFVPYWEKKSLHVKVYEWYENAEESFAEIDDVSVQPRENSVIKKCNITTSGDNLNGVVSMYAIIHFENNKVIIFSFSECQDSFRLTEVESFTSANIFCSSINDVWLADGLQLAVVNGCKLFFYSPKAKRDYDMQKVLHMPVSCCKILNFLLVSHHNTSAGTVTLYILVISSSHMNPCKEKVQFLIYFQSSTMSIVNANICHVQTNLFFPVTFSSAVRAVDVHINKYPELPEISESCSLEEIVLHLPWKENRTVLCTKKQCMVFCRSFLQYCCSVPYSDVGRIFLIPIYPCKSQNLNIILQSSSSGVCCMRVKNKMNDMKCIQEWKDALRAVVGCILGNGTKCLLLLRSLDLYNWQNHYSIADMNRLFPYDGNGDSRGTASCSDYLRNAVIGLQKRVMAGKASVSELQYRISEKQVVTNEILRMLSLFCSVDSVVSNQSNVSFFQESLVDILPLNDSICVKNKNEKELKAAMKVTSHWKAALSGNCIFGWTLENISDSYILNPNVHLVIGNTCEKAIQKLFIHPSEGLPCQPRLNDSALEQVVIKHGDMLSLVLCFPVPPFFNDVINGSFVISWYECKTLDNLGFYFSSTLEENACQQIIMKSTIAVSDVLEKHPLQGLSVVQQLMSFRVLQQHSILLISAMYSDLSAFEETVKSSDQWNSPLLINHLEMKLFIFNNVHSALYGINMSWKQLDTTRIEIAVHSRNVKEIIFLTQWMYSILPDDVLILPRNMKLKETSETRNRMLVSMKNEVNLIFEYLSSPSCTAAQIPKTYFDKEGLEKFEINENHAYDKIVFSKEKFHEMRESLLKNELLTDTVIKKLYDFCYN